MPQILMAERVTILYYLLIKLHPGALRNLGPPNPFSLIPDNLAGAEI